MRRKRLVLAALAAALCLLPAVAAFAAEPGSAGSWHQENGQWYYCDENGAMRTGWVWVGAKCYYLYEDGHCAMNEITPDGYRVDASGAWYEVKQEILGQQFTVPARFVAPQSAWGDNGQALNGLAEAVNTAFGGSRKLSVTEDWVEYMSSDGANRYMGLYKENGEGGYRLDLRVRLDRSGEGKTRAAQYDYGVFQALATAVSSTPEQLEEAICSAWQGQNTYGINRTTPVEAGDCTVTYEAGEGYGKFFIRP